MKSLLRSVLPFLSSVLFIGVSNVFAEAPASDWRVTTIDGPVAIFPKGSAKASPAVKGLPLKSGDRLITSGKARAEIVSEKGSVLELKEGSYCRFTRSASGRENFFLKTGRLLGQFASGGNYRVRSPVMVACIRGTQLGVDVADDGTTESGVAEGTVDFKKPVSGPDATMNWSDEDPRWEQDEEAVEQQPTEVQAETSEGVVAKPNGRPEKLPTLPPVIVSELQWFKSVRERVPALRDEWKALDTPSAMKLRQQALREVVQWHIPEKFQPVRVEPTKPTPKKLTVPKPK